LRVTCQACRISGKGLSPMRCPLSGYERTKLGQGADVRW
jgi:hypothetical protein